MKLGSAVRIAIVSALAVTSCDKSTAQPTTPPADDSVVGSEAGEAPTDEASAADASWGEMSFDQRKSFMAKKVLPQMKTAFSSHDADLFKGFKCDTCHGDDDSFAMPNEGMYPLSADDPLASGMEYDEKITRFMSEEIVPQMAELLGKEPWSPENPEGVGCFTCHPAE
jgi:hypothetical protein